jgi:hypothetical protein
MELFQSKTMRSGTFAFLLTLIQLDIANLIELTSDLVVE